ncbi:hypothetical protein [Actinomadura macrotermitis]|uniref:DUF3558 domain-containing protein n=1 Tax=Actinomadura macrotermitis TaxID=2585200 RepID=A0A7K0BSQ6_9ACTN|nr:hypothetical protein [Actinomadura macrotermitis]MQY04235.1 hypothetical protein [Actinomadura macrotermitis]
MQCPGRSGSSTLCFERVAKTDPVRPPLEDMCALPPPGTGGLTLTARPEMRDFDRNVTSCRFDIAGQPHTLLMLRASRPGPRSTETQTQAEMARRMFRQASEDMPDTVPGLGEEARMRAESDGRHPRVALNVRDNLLFVQVEYDGEGSARDLETVKRSVRDLAAALLRRLPAKGA